MLEVFILLEDKGLFLKRDAGGELYKASMTFKLGALKWTPCLAESKIICEGCFKKKSLLEMGDYFGSQIQGLGFLEASLYVFCFQPF